MAPDASAPSQGLPATPRRMAWLLLIFQALLHSGCATALLVFGMAGLLAAAAVPLFRTETAGRH